MKILSTPTSYGINYVYNRVEEQHNKKKKVFIFSIFKQIGISKCYDFEIVTPEKKDTNKKEKQHESNYTETVRCKRIIKW